MNESQAILAAIQAEAPITSLHGLWAGNPAIFTRRPAPDQTTFPFTVISKPTGQFNQDLLTSQVGTVLRQIATYGLNPDKERVVEQIADLIRELFHEKKDSLQIDGRHILSIKITGPVDAPTSDETITGMMCQIAIKAQKL